MKKQNHHFHMLNMSPWPIISAIAAMMLLESTIKWMWSVQPSLMTLSLSMLLITSALWWRDVARESTLIGLHTKNTVSALQAGMILFIVSEVMFFFSFFWAFFNTSLNPVYEVGICWPPSGTQPFNYTGVPLLNTLILLTSGVTVTAAHHAVSVSGAFSKSKMYMNMTIILGVYFSLVQMMEYMEAPFSISDSGYGGCFFVATGFHGLHVIIGTSFLLITVLRMNTAHLSPSHHVGMEASIWYWHFVDVVWLFLYTAIYWWGS